MKSLNATQKKEVLDAVQALMNVDDQVVGFWLDHIKMQQNVFLRSDLANCKNLRVQVISANSELKTFFRALKKLD